MKDHISRIAREKGMSPISSSWSGVDVVLPLLELARRERAIIVVKIDGERGPDDTGQYTVLVSGGLLGGETVRADEDSIEEALALVIALYASKCWGISLPT